MHTLQPARHDLYDGDEWQRKLLLGSATTDLAVARTSHVRLPFHQAMLQCIRHPQVGVDRLSDPTNRQLNDLHSLIANDLQLDDLTHLKIFPSLYTSADHDHGVDCIIVYTDPDTGEEAVVTVDVSINPGKERDETFKADVLLKPTMARVRHESYPGGLSITVPDIAHQSKEEEFAAKRQTNEKIARMIATLIRHKIEHGDHRNYALYARRARLGDDIHRALRDLLTAGRQATAHPGTPGAPAQTPVRRMDSPHRGTADPLHGMHRLATRQDRLPGR